MILEAGPAAVQAEEDEDGHAAEAERLFRQPAEFVRGVVDRAGLPDGRVPEIAFAGRSNVGKSSLLNALLNRKRLARTSNTPGRTRELNYFLVGGRLHVVDMPGYGFAKAPKTMVAGWNALIADYLRGRPQLARVMLLIDARHGVKPSDEAAMGLMDGAAVPYRLVLTKADKIGTAARHAVVEAAAAVAGRHGAAHPQVLLTSAVDGDGIEELRIACVEALDRFAGG